MIWIIGKVIIASIVISFASWIARSDVKLGGFIIALPISSMLSLAFFNVQYQEPEATVQFARSILFSIPLTIVFFIPFLFAEKFKLPFWGLYGMGLALIFVGYAVQTYFFQN